MKKNLKMTTLLGWLLIASPASAQDFDKPADVKAITNIEMQLATQTRMAPLIGYYAPDAVVFDMFTPGLYEGRAQIYAAFQKQLVPVKAMTHQMQEMNIASDGAFACSAMQMHFDTVLKSGQNYHLSVRQLDAFKKIHGKWQIIQEQISVPVDPKTGMPVMDGPLPARGQMAWSDDPVPASAENAVQAKADILNWMVQGSAVTSIGAMMPYYGPGDDVLVYNEFYPGELRGLGEIERNYAPVMGSFSAITDKMPVFFVDSDGAFGVQIDRQDMRLTLKDGSKKVISLRQSDCMRRVSGRWYSFFEMLSFPVDPATGKAVMANPAAF